MVEMSVSRVSVSVFSLANTYGNRSALSSNNLSSTTTWPCKSIFDTAENHKSTKGRGWNKCIVSKGIDCTRSLSGKKQSNKNV
jgi:hypothetical protein